jgi:hypothetical protein
VWQGAEISGHRFSPPVLYLPEFFACYFALSFNKYCYYQCFFKLFSDGTVRVARSPFSFRLLPEHNTNLRGGYNNCFALNSIYRLVSWPQCQAAPTLDTTCDTISIRWKCNGDTIRYNTSRYQLHTLEAIHADDMHYFSVNTPSFIIETTFEYS